MAEIFVNTFICRKRSLQKTKPSVPFPHSWLVSMTLKNVGKIFDNSIEQESSASHISSTIVMFPTIQKNIATALTPLSSRPSLSAGCCQAHFLPGPEPSLRCGGARWWSDVRCDRLPGCIGPAARCAHVRVGQEAQKGEEAKVQDPQHTRARVDNRSR